MIQVSCCIIIKSDGSIGRVVMPEMDTKMITTKGYRKLLDVLEILKPGARNEFIKHNQMKGHKRLH